MDTVARWCGDWNAKGGMADHTDTNLVNPCGIAIQPRLDEQAKREYRQALQV